MTAARAHIDFETASAAELAGPRSVGVHKYAEDETTRVWLFSYSFGDGLVLRWYPGGPDPVKLLQFIAGGGIVVAHNAMFERVMWSFMRDKYNLHHWPELRAEQQRCTMAKAMAMDLPASLDALADVLDTKNKKDLAGAALMKKMAKPIVNKHSKFLAWHDSPENLERLSQYCDTDVETETDIDNLVPDLSPSEQRIWTLDQKINDRGIPIDVHAVTRAVEVTAYAKVHANQLMKEYTGGKVNKCTEVGQILAWINDQGINCQSFRKGDHDDILVMSAFAGNTMVEKVVKLRRGAGKTSTSKFAKMLDCVCLDGRIRGQFQYHGAGPGRWAGRLVQPQNLKRVDWERDEDSVTFAIGILHSRLSIIDMYDMMAMVTDSVLDLLTLCIRAMIRAEEGHIFYCADWSNIEGRVNAWLAGEAWKLQAFVDYDNKVGPDLYKLAYSRSFGKDVALIGKGPERQIGKVQELALGYQGGVGAFITMGLTYNVKTWDLVEPVRAATPPSFWESTMFDFDSATDKNGLPQEQWAAVKIIVKNWRNAHPNITASWYELQDAAVQAVNEPNTVVEVYSGRVRYLSDTKFLYCQLPDGRVICYPQPHLRHEVTKEIEVNGVWMNCDQFFPYEIELMEMAGAKIKTQKRNVVWFYGVDPTTKQWRPAYLYGGHQCENIVQATAASILRSAMVRIEDAGYDIVLHAHDEILSHVKKGFGSLKHFESLMLIDEPWLAGLPLSVSSFEDERYVK